MMRWDISQESGTAEPELSMETAHIRGYWEVLEPVQMSSLHALCQLDALWRVWGACLGYLESTGICFLYRVPDTESQNCFGLKRALKRSNAGEISFSLCKLGPYSGLPRAREGRAEAQNRGMFLGTEWKWGYHSLISCLPSDKQKLQQNFSNLTSGIGFSCCIVIYYCMIISYPEDKRST